MKNKKCEHDFTVYLTADRRRTYSVAKCKKCGKEVKDFKDMFVIDTESTTK